MSVACRILSVDSDIVIFNVDNIIIDDIYCIDTLECWVMVVEYSMWLLCSRSVQSATSMKQ